MCENFWNGLDIYRDKYEKGLKKQANQYIESFIKEWTASLSEEEQENILYCFCKEICEGEKLSWLWKRGNGSLPFELSKVVWKYLKKQCEQGTMPQMRWAFQIYGTSYNPFNPKWELNMLEVLYRAYEHSDCDQRTVDLYFQELLERLYWGAHHFPEGCIIKRESYEETVRMAEVVLMEKQVAPELVKRYHDYVTLYQCFYEYEESGREKDFYELCERSGIIYKKMPAYYYQK